MSELRRRALLSTLGGGIPRDGLIAEYLFNNNLNDTSGNGYNLIKTNATGNKATLYADLSGGGYSGGTGAS